MRVEKQDEKRTEKQTEKRTATPLLQLHPTLDKSSLLTAAELSRHQLPRSSCIHS